MSRLRLAWLVLAVHVAGCASPRDNGGDRGPAPVDTSNPSSSVAATRFRIETVMFELPLPIAEELYARAQDADSTLGTSIDEAQCREALELLVKTNPAIKRSARPTVDVGLAELAHVPPRIESRIASAGDAAAGSRASDSLVLDVRVLRGQGWTPIDLEARVRWTDSHGRVLGRLPSSTTPLPDSRWGGWMQIVCLPSKRDAESSKTPALFVFLRAISIDPVSDANASAR